MYQISYYIYFLHIFHFLCYKCDRLLRIIVQNDGAGEQDAVRTDQLLQGTQEVKGI